MLFLRRILSLFFFLVVLGCVGIFVALFSVRYLGTQGEVSQVFHLDQATALGGGRFIGVYNVAITPKDQTAQICEMVALTQGRYVDLLDRQVWLWPVADPLFAYDENPQSRVAMWGGLFACFFLAFLCYSLWKRKE